MLQPSVQRSADLILCFSAYTPVRKKSSSRRPLTLNMEVTLSPLETPSVFKDVGGNVFCTARPRGQLYCVASHTFVNKISCREEYKIKGVELTSSSLVESSCVIRVFNCSTSLSAVSIRLLQTSQLLLETMRKKILVSVCRYMIQFK